MLPASGLSQGRDETGMGQRREGSTSFSVEAVARPSGAKEDGNEPDP